MISIFIMLHKMNGLLASIDLVHLMVEEWLHYGLNWSIACYGQNLDFDDSNQ